jgi:hypothetical protein
VRLWQSLSGARGRQVLGTVKNALVVWMGILFLADVVTPLQARPEPRAGSRMPDLPPAFL